MRLNKYLNFRFFYGANTSCFISCLLTFGYRWKDPVSTLEPKEYVPEAFRSYTHMLSTSVGCETDLETGSIGVRFDLAEIIARELGMDFLSVQNLEQITCKPNRTVIVFCNGHYSIATKAKKVFMFVEDVVEAIKRGMQKLLESATPEELYKRQQRCRNKARVQYENIKKKEQKESSDRANRLYKCVTKAINFDGKNYEDTFLPLEKLTEEDAVLFTEYFMYLRGFRPPPPEDSFPTSNQGVNLLMGLRKNKFKRFYNIQGTCDKWNRRTVEDEASLMGHGRAGDLRHAVRKSAKQPRGAHGGLGVTHKFGAMASK